MRWLRRKAAETSAPDPIRKSLSGIAESTPLVESNPGIPVSEASVGLLDELSGLPESSRTEILRAAELWAQTGDLSAASNLAAAALAGHPWRWPRFEQDRDRFRNLGYVPYMWKQLKASDDPVTKDPPDLGPQVLKIAHLSSDARLALALSGGLTGLHLRTAGGVEERTGMDARRTRDALDELVSRGLAESPSLELRLTSLTAENLKKMAAQLGLSKSGTKSRMAEAITKDAAEGETIKLLEKHHPGALDPTLLAIGIGKESESLGWLRNFSAALVHYSTFLGYRQREIDQAQRGRAGMIGWRRRTNDECPVCSDAVQVVPLDRHDLLPPFHIGCRCMAVGEFSNEDFESLLVKMVEEETFTRPNIFEYWEYRTNAIFEFSEGLRDLSEMERGIALSQIESAVTYAVAQLSDEELLRAAVPFVDDLYKSAASANPIIWDETVEQYLDASAGTMSRLSTPVQN